MDNLFFKYRKGSLYEAGLFGFRTLVIGESHPCDKKEECQYWKLCTDVSVKDSSKFNTICAYSDAPTLSETTIFDIDNHITGGHIIKSYDIFSKFMFECLGNLASSQEFFERVTFVDFVQFFVPEISIKENWLSERDYFAMEEVVNDVGPELIIFWGTKVGNYFKSIDRRDSGIEGVNMDYLFVHNICQKDRLVLNTYHPSGRYQCFAQDRMNLQKQIDLLSSRFASFKAILNR